VRNPATSASLRIDRPPAVAEQSPGPKTRLREYARRRRFDVTSEPSPEILAPKLGARRALRFVVQKHAASRLHYDFRLEWDGSLLSWAVPKGPSVNPAVKRLAMAVEDHPISYADFEGIIPAGEYGGGTVMVWDRGTYAPADPDVGRSWRAGRMRFTLQGEKLRGEWLLVRTGARDSRSWLLMKHGSDGTSATDVTEQAPRSVKSKRLMAEIAFDEGGDVTRAARADPAAAIRSLLRDPATRKRVPRTKPAVWNSNRSRKESTPSAIRTR